MTTFPTVERIAADAISFVDAVDRVVAGLVFRYRPPLVALVRIRKWFDHRWLRFSGLGRVFVDPPWPSHAGVALREHHQEQLTFPPFAPTRIAGESHWLRSAGGGYTLAADPPRIHRLERQHSSANLQRRVAGVAATALYVWFSSSSASDGRGSMLVYAVNAGEAIPWFASMRADAGTWSLGEVKGLGRAEIAELLEHPPGVRRGPSPLER